MVRTLLFLASFLAVTAQITVAQTTIDPAIVWLLTRPVYVEEGTPEEFDFSNFHTVSLTFTVPSDLPGQIDLKIYGEWDNQIQDLYLGRGSAGGTKTVDINIPTALTRVYIEYLAYDLDTNQFVVRTVGESL